MIAGLATAERSVGTVVSIIGRHYCRLAKEFPAKDKRT
jgi:hypothetical protein